MTGRDLVIEKGNTKLSQWVDPSITVTIDDGTVTFTRVGDERRERALHGLYRSIANNMVVGLTKGYEKRLRIEGVGFGAQLKGKVVEMNVGYANKIPVDVPPGVTVKIPDPQTVVVSGADKQMVGQVAAELRAARPPEPYKGKGVRYADEAIKRKAGKTVGAG